MGNDSVEQAAIQLLRALGKNSEALAYFQSCSDFADRIRTVCENESMETALNAIEAVQPIDSLVVVMLALERDVVMWNLGRIRRSGARKKHAIHDEPAQAVVVEWWRRWKESPGLYKNKTAFDMALADKTGKALRTIEKWRLNIQKSDMHPTSKVPKSASKGGQYASIRGRTQKE